MSNIKMYGTPTCRDCVIAKQVFQELGTDYEFINIEDSQEATEKVIKLNNGVRRIPVILFADNTILVEPTGEELKSKMLS
jgi:glutaredoxin